MRNVLPKPCRRKLYTMHCDCRITVYSVVSSTQYSVWVLLMELVPPLIGIAVVMLILAAIMSVHMANKIVEPINNVDLEHPEENQIYEEVGPLLSKIYKQNRQIKSQLEAARRNRRVWHYYRKHAGRSSCY